MNFRNVSLGCETLTFYIVFGLTDEHEREIEPFLNVFTSQSGRLFNSLIHIMRWSILSLPHHRFRSYNVVHVELFR